MAPVLPKRRASREHRVTQKHAGDSAERVVLGLNALCASLGVARIRKMPTPLRVIGSGFQRGQRVLHAIPSEKSGVDWVGSMHDGRAVYVESKSCTQARFMLALVQPHQRAELDWAEDSGAVAVLLVLYGPLWKPHAIPWREVRQLEHSGAKSLGPADLAPYAIAAGTAYLGRWEEGRPR